MDVGIRGRTGGDFDAALQRAREALVANGFGVLTEIDVSGTIKAKIGEDIPRTHILGACKPDFAHRALQATTDVAMLMPCNVVLRQDGDGIAVEAMDPSLMGTVLADEAMAGLAGEAREILGKVVADITG